jgi:hypothetical protein
MKTTPGKSSQPAFNSAAPSRTSKEIEQASLPKVPPFFKDLSDIDCGASSTRAMKPGRCSQRRENDAVRHLR